MTATDSTWFYLKQDGSPMDEGESGGFYPDIEWNASPAASFPVVYTGGTTANIQLKFSSPQFYAFDATLTVYNARLRIPPTTALGSDTYITLSATVTDADLSFPVFGGTDYASISVSGIPAYVTRGYLEIDAKVFRGVQLHWTTGGYQSWEYMYVPDSAPEGLQTVPWTDLLDLSCAWAINRTGSTSVMWGLSFGMNRKGQWDYDPWQPRYWKDPDSEFETNDNEYDLSEALASPGEMDCQDVSGFIHLAAASLGHTATITCSWRDLAPDRDNDFWTTPLCPMGSDAQDIDNYDLYPFSYHQYNQLGGVHDASSSYLLRFTGSLWKMPPDNWPLSAHWQTPWNGSYVGLVLGVPTGDPLDPIDVVLVPRKTIIRSIQSIK